MIAVKGNRVYKISEAEKESRRADGYDIYDDDGAVIAYGKGKTVPYDQYAAVVAELEALKAKKTGRAKTQEKETTGEE